MVPHNRWMATKSGEIDGYLCISQLDRLILEFPLKFWHARYCNITTLPASTKQHRRAVLGQSFIHKLEFWLTLNISPPDSCIKINDLLQFRINFWTHKTFVRMVESNFSGERLKIHTSIFHNEIENNCPWISVIIQGRANWQLPLSLKHESKP